MRIGKIPIILTAATGSLALVAAVTTGTASATTTSRSSADRVLNTTAVAPFQVGLRHGQVYYTDGFAGTVTKLTHRGPKVIAHVKGGEIAGAAFSGRRMAFASSGPAGTTLTIRRPGRRAIVADLGRYENTVNPDRHVTYGIIAGSTPCAVAAAKQATQLPATYKGIKDSHPYQVQALPHGAWAVADAAANAILRVDSRGRIRTLALLPRQPITFTAAQAHALGASCLKGVTYAFEPVPTDVERDGRGNLWVSTLPGGPEDPSLGARGSVYRINRHGAVHRVATGFLGATNLAVTRGRIYVAELFKNRISTIRRGRIVTAVSIARPLSVKATRHHLYVGQMADVDLETGKVNGPGGIYRFRR